MGAIFGYETFKQWVFELTTSQLAAVGKSRVSQPLKLIANSET
jgi:hypothetical protein